MRFSTLNKGFISKTGNYINYNNTIETPTSSNNGYIRNIVNVKKFYNRKNSILAIQGKFGNIFSLNNSDMVQGLVIQERHMLVETILQY